MSVNIEFVKVDQAHVDFIARNMREADAKEVAASHGVTPHEAIRDGIRASKWVSVALADGEPVAVVGLVQGDVLSGIGTPWLLGTDRLFEIGKTLTRHSLIGLQQMLEKCPRLENYVHVENTTSIKWLKVLGFNFDDPIPLGRNGEMFHRFWMVK